MPKRRNSLLVTAVALVLALAPVAGACPLCDSGTGEQVRAGIAGDSLPSAVLAVLLPFAVTAGVVAVVHFGIGIGGPSRRHDGDDDHPYR
jgi:hypothetical protein